MMPNRTDQHIIDQTRTDRNELLNEAMEEREQALNYIQTAHTTGICGVQDMVLPAFFREVFEER